MQVSTEQMLIQTAVAVAGIILGSLISEDAATLGAATLAATRTLDPAIAFAAAATGIWVGDLGLYALARRFGPSLASRPWFARRVDKNKIEQAHKLARRWGAPALALSRFVPGTRLAATLASGFLRMPVRRFAGVTAAGSVVWVLAVFCSVLALRMHTSSTASAVAIVALPLIALGVIVSRRKALAVTLTRWRQWEFWPPWVFYVPVAAMCVRLAMRYRGLALPTVANLNQKNGGMIGESKAEILEQLQQAAPESVARTRLIAPGAVEERLDGVRRALEAGGLEFPFIFKPDVGQRGAGFRIVRDWEQARQYLERVPAPVVMQQYAEGPHEAGIFYYRLPGEERGAIFAITHKIFPSVRGDGRSTVAELIAADPRARLMAHVYGKRLAAKNGAVLAAGERLQLVEAGNHCQGCIFEDGMRLRTDGLATKIDEISRKLEGFYIGRYDVRYASEDDLARGLFLVIELNGASSEATSIYDARNSLREAYSVLYRQWDLVYRIGALNRSRGHAPAGIRAVLRDWFEYRRTAAVYPMAD